MLVGDRARRAGTVRNAVTSIEGDIEDIANAPRRTIAPRASCQDEIGVLPTGAPRAFLSVRALW